MDFSLFNSFFWSTINSEAEIGIYLNNGSNYILKRSQITINESDKFITFAGDSMSTHDTKSKNVAFFIPIESISFIVIEKENQ